MKFTKMQGIGNDYIYVNCFEETVTDPETVAKKISDRQITANRSLFILLTPASEKFFRFLYNGFIEISVAENITAVFNKPVFVL